MSHETNSPAVTFHTRTLGLPAEEAPLRLVWAHGWGHSGAAFQPMAQALATQAHHILLDFPGFGASPVPTAAWGTADYADATAAILPPFSGTTVWVGHSFGCRVGLQLAARHHAVLQGMVLVAGAGLPRKRPLFQRVWFTTKVYTFKALKHLYQELGRDVTPLRAHFGSADYKTAGPLRAIFVKTVAEDLSEVATRVQCPTALVYGENDTSTPPEIGQRLAHLIPGATLAILPGQDHYSLIGEGRHNTLKILSQFIKRYR